MFRIDNWPKLIKMLLNVPNKLSCKFKPSIGDFLSVKNVLSLAL